MKVEVQTVTAAEITARTGLTQMAQWARWLDLEDVGSGHHRTYTVHQARVAITIANLSLAWRHHRTTAVGGVPGWMVEEFRVQSMFDEQVTIRLGDYGTLTIDLAPWEDDDVDES